MIELLFAAWLSEKEYWVRKDAVFEQARRCLQSTALVEEEEKAS